MRFKTRTLIALFVIILIILVPVGVVLFFEYSKPETYPASIVRSEKPSNSAFNQIFAEAKSLISLVSPNETATPGGLRARFGSTDVYDIRKYYNVTNVSGMIRGKVLVWDYSLEKEAFNVEALLPSGLVASSAEENVTIFAIVQQPGYSTQEGDLDIVGIFWPEKRVAFTETLPAAEDDFYHEYFWPTSQVVANWIKGLSVIDSVPSYLLFCDKGDALKALREDTPQETQIASVQGKIIIWDFAADSRGKAVDVEKYLPLDRRAPLSDNSFTLFAIVNSWKTQVGTYIPKGEPFSIGDTPAYVVHYDLIVISYPENEAIGSHTVTGDYPPNERVEYGMVGGGWVDGEIKKPTADWIISLLK